VACTLSADHEICVASRRIADLLLGLATGP
jgi:hypothetical protein